MNVHYFQSLRSSTRQTLVQGGGRQVVEVQVAVILVRADAASLANLHGHGSRHDIPGRKILRGRCVSGHERLTLAVLQDTTLTTASLGYQAARREDTYGTTAVSPISASNHRNGIDPIAQTQSDTQRHSLIHILTRTGAPSILKTNIPAFGKSKNHETQVVYP